MLHPKKCLNVNKDLKLFIKKYAPESKIIISTPALPKEAKPDCITLNDNIAESNIDQYRLHINKSGSVILAKNLISGIRNF